MIATPMFSDTISLAVNGDAEVGSNYIAFGQYPNGAPYNKYPLSGVVQTTQPINGIFASNGVVAGENATIFSLDATQEPVGTQLNPSGTPPGTPFVYFQGGGSNLQLYLTEILPGSFAPGSPFNVSSGPGGTAVNFAVNGDIWNTTSMSLTPYVGLFSATFVGQDIGQLVGSLPEDTSFSGTFTVTTIPEPASMLLVGAGLLGAGLVARRKKVRS